MLVSINPAKLKIQKQNCVGGNPRFAKTKNKKLMCIKH